VVSVCLVAGIGLGPVAECMFPLDMRDPDFDEKPRARGSNDGFRR
jgi:hypothetical protein